MHNSIPLGIAIPQTFPGRPIDPRAILAFIERAEALGFDSAWVEEETVGTIPILDPIELLAFASATTTRMRLGCAVLLSALRNPVHLAKSLATLDHLSGGRLTVGVGLGEATEYARLGIPAGGRADRFVEGLTLVQRLWAEPRVTMAGRFYNVENLAMEPKPLQQPRPPLLFGGRHPRAIRRAVDMGDGFIGAGSTPTAGFANQVRMLDGFLAEARRDPGFFSIGKRVYLAVDADRDRALARLSEWFRAFYGDYVRAEAVAVWGSPEECVAQLKDVVSAGAQYLVLNPVYDEWHQLEVIAEEVAPRL